MVAPPMSKTRTSPSVAAASVSMPASIASGVAALTIDANWGPLDRCLPPMTWRRNIWRMAARAPSGLMTPIWGSTLSVKMKRRPVDSSASATSSRASTLPATTTGALSRALASAEPLCSSTSALPSSVPPASRMTSGRAARSATTSAVVIGPAATCTILAPALRPTREPASAVTERS